jgi:hypothetical protein
MASGSSAALKKMKSILIDPEQMSDAEKSSIRKASLDSFAVSGRVFR